MADHPELLQKVFQHIEDNEEQYYGPLGEAVAIESVSTWPHYRDELIKMVYWFGEKLSSIGVEVEYADLGMQTFSDGTQAKLPPVIMGQLGNCLDKKTLLVYGHVDVQPAKKSDGWNSDPFVMRRENKRIYGRGVSDDKGPILAWIHAIEAYQKLSLDLPVNVKFCLEGMEESDSQGFDDFLMSRKETDFMKQVDYVCITDNSWLGKNKPCLTYGLRGIAYFSVKVECSNKDLHSGTFGGVVHDAMSDLVYMMNTLVDKDGKILVDGIYDSVLPVTEEEKVNYAALDFEMQQFQEDLEIKHLYHDCEKVKTLIGMWNNPSLSLHGIEGAWSENGTKTVIPGKVIGKFSIRLVANQTPYVVEKNVKEYLSKKWEERGSKNLMSVELMEAPGRPWITDPNSKNFEAGKSAFKMVYGVEPDLTREGGSIPVTLTLQDATQKDVMLLAFSNCDEAAHSTNENLLESNYIEGTKVLGAYLYQLSKLWSLKPFFTWRHIAVHRK